MHGFNQRLEAPSANDDAPALPRSPRLVAPSSAERPRLLRTIENEIIPRLVLAQRAAPAPAPVPALDGWMPKPDAIADFARLVLTKDAAVACAYAENLFKRGVPTERLYLDLLAPAAQHLGWLWEEDLCDFASVTSGLVRLQQVLHALQPMFHDEGGQRFGGRRALIVPVPGEQHTFGLFMVAAFFRRAGWSVTNDPLAALDDIVRLVSAQPFAIVGFSAGSEVRVNAIAATIRAVRRASCNRGVGILVGGPLFLEQPELAPLVGADAMAADGRAAVAQAQNLLSLLGRPG